jgi:ribosomal protein S18 acetylase RimI-like enzyme
MVSWRAVLPSDDAARALLDQYVQARAAGFPAGADAYRRSTPSDADFTPPTGVFVLVEGENLAGEPADVGCGGVRRIADGALGARYEVKHLWIQPHARRLGFGRSLMEELIRHSRELEATEVVLDTNRSLREAGELYQSLGFVPTDPYNDNPNATTWLARKL